jgi:transposase
MSNKPKTMLQIRKIIQYLSDGYSARKISKMVPANRRTVNTYAERAQASGLSYEALLLLKDAELGEKMLSKKEKPAPTDRATFVASQSGYYKKELQRPGVTLYQLWQEYLQKNPEGYGYSWFCEQYTKTGKTPTPVYHEENEPGKTILIECPTLVCTWAYSNLTYVEPLKSARLELLIPALNRMLRYSGAVPKESLFDNMKQMVTKADRYEPSFTEAAEAWGVHNRIFIKATRPGKPKDKSAVEKHVDIAYTHIYAPLRNVLITSQEQLVSLTLTQLNVLNNRPQYKNLPSRWEKFEKEEKPLLRLLPDHPFVLKKSTNAKVKPNYHVILGEDWHQYSVPWEYIGQQTRIIYDSEVVEVFIELKRIAVHKRCFRQNRYTTLEEHMPESHLRYKQQRGWSGDDFLEQASRIGTETSASIERILSSKSFIEQTYDACLGTLRLAKKYNPERLEAACKRANRGIRINYKTIQNILKNNLDQEPSESPDLFTSLPEHDNIRGAESYR